MRNRHTGSRLISGKKGPLAGPCAVIIYYPPKRTGAVPVGVDAVVAPADAAPAVVAPTTFVASAVSVPV